MIIMIITIIAPEGCVLLDRIVGAIRWHYNHGGHDYIQATRWHSLKGVGGLVGCARQPFGQSHRQQQRCIKPARILPRLAAQAAPRRRRTASRGRWHSSTNRSHRHRACVRACECMCMHTCVCTCVRACVSCVSCMSCVRACVYSHEYRHVYVDMHVDMCMTLCSHMYRIVCRCGTLRV